MAGMAPGFQSLLDTASRTRTLHLTYMSISQVPQAVWQLTDLVRLDLGGNSLETLPPEIGKMTKLEELWLNGNKFTDEDEQMLRAAGGDVSRVKVRV